MTLLDETLPLPRFRAAVCKRVCPVLSDRCLSVLSVTLVYCGQTVRWIKVKLGMQVGLSPATLNSQITEKRSRFTCHSCYLHTSCKHLTYFQCNLCLAVSGFTSQVQNLLIHDDAEINSKLLNLCLAAVRNLAAPFFHLQRNHINWVEAWLTSTSTI